MPVDGRATSEELAAAASLDSNALVALTATVAGKQDAIPTGTYAGDAATTAALATKLPLASSLYVYEVAPPTGVAATDTASIMGAVEAVRTGPGVGTVQLQPGVYLVNLSAHPVTGDPYYAAIVLPSGVALRGAGKGATTIKLANSQVTAAKTNNVIYNRAIAAGGDVNITVSDLTIDGNNVNNTAEKCGGVAFLRARHVIVERVRCTNLRGTGSGPPNENFYFEFGLGTDATFSDCEAVHTAGSSGSGFSANSASNVKWTHCVAYGMSVGHGFTHNTCRAVTYTSCHSYLNAGYGFNSEASEDVIYNTCIAGGDTALAATYPYASNTTLGNVQSGMVVNGSIRVQVIGCIVRHNTGNGLQTVGVSSGRIIGGEYTANTFGGITIVTASLGAWVVSGKPIISGNGAPQYLNVTSTPVIGAVTLAVPATTVATTSIYPQDATVYVTAGAGSTLVVAVGGTTVMTLAASTTGTFRLPATQTFTYTYTSAPTHVCILEG